MGRVPGSKGKNIGQIASGEFLGPRDEFMTIDIDGLSSV